MRKLEDKNVRLKDDMCLKDAHEADTGTLRAPEGHAREADWLTDRIGLGSCRPLK